MKKHSIKEIKTMTVVVIVCISFIILYTISQVILNYSLGLELSPTLTTCVYTFFGTELALCAFIKIFEKKVDKSDTQIDNPLPQMIESEAYSPHPVVEYSDTRDSLIEDLQDTENY